MFPGPAERVLFPAYLSVTQEAACLLAEMADDMGISVDELLSAIAEDSVSGLNFNKKLKNLEVPDSCSREHLIRLLNNK